MIPTYAGLLRCTRCSHLSADLALSDAELLKIYSAGYFAGEEYGNYLADKAVLQKNFAARLRTIRELIGDTSCLSLFEVGCAYGFFLELAQYHFAFAEGIDVAADAVQCACRDLGVNAHVGNFLELNPDNRPRPIDVVCMWDTIEHLRDPDAFIAKTASMLNHNGHLFLSTGDAGSLNARWRKGKWRLIHPPTHLHYFTRESMRTMLHRHGFTIVDIRSVGFYRSVGNTLSILFRDRIGPISQSRLTSMYYYLNLYDIMLVYARKS